MYLIETVNAFMAVLYLMNKETDYNTAHELMILKQRLSPHVEFFSSEEGKLIQTFGKKDAEGNVEIRGGRLLFADGADPMEYEKKRRELCAVAVEWTFERGRLTPPKEIRPVHIESLLPFADFGEVGG